MGAVKRDLLPLFPFSLSKNELLPVLGDVHLGDPLLVEDMTYHRGPGSRRGPGTRLLRDQLEPPVAG